MTDLAELKNVIEAHGAAAEKFMANTMGRVEVIENTLNEVLKKGNRPSIGGDIDPTVKKKTASFYDVKTRQSVPALEYKDRLADLEGQSEELPSMGRVLRGILLGGRADDAKALEDERKALGIAPDPSGGYTVAGALSSMWIDALRAQMVLSQAGALTIPMETNSLSLAMVTGDPTIKWHGENAVLPEASPTFGAVTLTAKTVTCLVKLSLELSQDSANIEQILENTITSAMALAIDQAGLSGAAVDAMVAPSGILNLSGRNKVLAIGAPTTWDFLIDGMYELAVDNVPMDSIGAFIAHPAVWKKMRKLKTGIASDNTPLTMPQEVGALPKLWTTSAPLTGGTTAMGVIANWRDLLFGVRKDITVQVLRETYLGSNLQIAVLAYARVDFAATRQQSFCTLEGITV